MADEISNNENIFHSVLKQMKAEIGIDILLEYSKSTDARNVKISGFGKWENYKFDENSLEKIM